MKHLVEEYKVVQLTPPVTSNGGVATDIISLKNCNMLYIVAEMTQAAAHATVLAPQQATDVSGTGAKVLANAVKVWANEDTAASDTLVAQTDAVNYTVTADAKNKQVVFQIDPALLDLANNFDCIKLTFSDSSEATNFVSATAYLDYRYGANQPETAITD